MRRPRCSSAWSWPAASAARAGGASTAIEESSTALAQLGRERAELAAVDIRDQRVAQITRTPEQHVEAPHRELSPSGRDGEALGTEDEQRDRMQPPAEDENGGAPVLE